TLRRPGRRPFPLRGRGLLALRLPAGRRPALVGSGRRRAAAGRAGGTRPFGTGGVGPVAGRAIGTRPGCPFTALASALAFPVALPAAGPAPPVRLLPGHGLDPGLDPRRGAAPQPAQKPALRLLDDLVLDVGLIHAQLVEGGFDRLGHCFPGCDDPFHRSRAFVDSFDYRRRFLGRGCEPEGCARPNPPSPLGRSPRGDGGGFGTGFDCPAPLPPDWPPSALASRAWPRARLNSPSCCGTSGGSGA